MREHFPFYSQPHPPIYLDSSATSHKPLAVIDTMDRFYRYENANIHRGVYSLSEKASAAYEGVREKTARFLGHVPAHQIVFTSGTTDSINLLSYSLSTWFKPQDEILLTVMEHHANLVPWQMLAQRTGVKLRFLPVNQETGHLDLSQLDRIWTDKVKLFACTHVSNVTGSIQPIKALCAEARARGAWTVVDGAQAVPHLKVDLKDIDPDFYVFSAHKMLGPTGVGVLYGRQNLLEQMPPFRGGGDMIRQVRLEGSTWQDPPYKFEAGTPPIAGVLGLGAALDFLMALSTEDCLEHERDLTDQVLDFLQRPHVRILSSRQRSERVGIVTFAHTKIHPHDMAALLDAHQVCIRGGHHCAQPLMHAFGVPASSRVSCYMYNTTSDIHAFMKAFEIAEGMLL